MKSIHYLLSIFVVAFGLLSLQFYQETKQLKRVIVANYTNNLAYTGEQMDHLRNAVHQSTLYKDEVALQEELSTISRLTANLKQSINHLPLDDGIRSSWNHYLTRLGSVADLAKKSGSSEWLDTIATASANIDELVVAWQDTSAELFKMDGNFAKWGELNKEETLQAFTQHANLLNNTREADFPLTASESDEEKKRDLQFLMDQEITKDEAVAKVITLFPQLEKATMTVSRNKDQSKYDFYHVQFVQGSRIGYIDITVKGGHILSYLLERPVDREKRLSHEEIRSDAEKFLKNIGIDDVVYVESRENQTAWHFVFSRQEGDLTIYPDSIQVKVSKDTGEVIGLNMMEYIQKEKIQTHAVQELQTDSFFRDDVEIIEVKKIVTNNELKESKVCYEVIAYKKGQENRTYRIVIDGESLVVQKIEVLH